MACDQVDRQDAAPAPSAGAATVKAASMRMALVSPHPARPGGDSAPPSIGDPTEDCESRRGWP